MFDRGKSDALFTDTLDLLDTLNTRDGRFEYADYVSLHNNITALYDSFSEVDELMEMDKAKAEGRLVVLPCKVGELKELYERLIQPSGDDAETYTTGYLNGHKNGQAEMIAYLLQINTGTREAAENALAEVGE